MCFQRQVRRLEQISMEKKRIDEGQDMYEEVKKEETQSVSNEQKNEEEENIKENSKSISGERRRTGTV